MPKTVVLLNHHLESYAGSELVTLDLAVCFKELGWDVAVGTFFYGKPVSELFEEHGIPVHNVLNHRLPKTEYDLMWAHHFPVGTKCLLNDGVKVRWLVLSSLSPLEPLETLPLFEEEADIILSHSPKNLEEMRRYGVRKDVRVLLNSVSNRWFAFNGKPAVHKPLKNIAVVSNHPPNEIVSACSLLAERNIRMDFYGKGNRYVFITPEILSGYDAVITIGRTVQHAMAAKIPVYCYDHFGGPGWLTARNHERAESWNYSGRCTNRKASPDELFRELTAGYDGACKDVDFFYQLAHERYNLTDNVRKIIEGLDPGKEGTIDLGRYRRALKLNQQYVGLLRSIAELHSAVSQRDQVIAGKDVMLAEKDETIVEKNKRLSQRDAAISQNNRLIARQEAIIREKNQFIREITNSLSWRMLQKYRIAASRLFPSGSKRLIIYEILKRALAQILRVNQSGQG